MKLNSAKTPKFITLFLSQLAIVAWALSTTIFSAKKSCKIY